MRSDDIDDLLAGYVTGPAAATEATAVALVRADAARTVVFVEGVSDQIAVETLARRHGHDLAAQSVAVLPIGGAHALPRYLRRFPAETRLTGCCDAGERHVVEQALTAAGVESRKFHFCVQDLEDELIRATGTARVVELFAAHGDLAAFRTIQRQPAWRGKAEAAQMRRFLAAGGQRKLRYARLLTEAVDLDRTPPPLAALLATL